MTALRPSARSWFRVALALILVSGFIQIAFGPSTSSAVRAQTSSTSPTAPEDVNWDALRRPLRPPMLAEDAACPRTEGSRWVSSFAGVPLGSGPVYSSLPFIGAINIDSRDADPDDGWHAWKVIWKVAPPGSDQPILIRGGRIDEPGELRFHGYGPEPVAELRLAGVGGISKDDPGWNHFTSGIYVPGPGCYAYQIDRADYSEVVVFEAAAERPEELTQLPPFGGLPHDLVLHTGIQVGSDLVRLALYGERRLVIRIDVGPTELMPLPSLGEGDERLDTEAGPVLWQAHPRYGWPQAATWDDGWHRYRLDVLAGWPSAWSEADLQATVEAFAAASRAGRDRST